MIIEYLYFYNSYNKVWIKGPFTQEQITRYASSCAYSVTKALRDQMGLSENDGGLLSNSHIRVHAIDVPCGMRTFNDSIPEMDENWFFFYWHLAGDANRDGR
jgi:hypothetical protein